MIKSIVLIPTILTALLPSLPNGNNFNPPIQNADPVSIIQWDIGNATRTNDQTLIEQIGNNQYIANISKYNINKSNNYINIKETTYTQTINRKNTYELDYRIMNYHNYNSIRYETSAIIITEITTYSGITNNTIDYEISLLNNNYAFGGVPEIEVDIMQYKTNNDLSKYINQTNYAILNNQLAIFTDITNNYSYTQTKNINDLTLNQYTNITTNIQLNNIWKTYMITYVKWIDTSQETLIDMIGDHTTDDLITMDTAEIFGIVHIPTGYEVVDIPTLMFTILTLPFSFITQAFNITLFPNTPYSINIGNLFLSIVAIILLMWLLQKIIGFFAKS